MATPRRGVYVIQAGKDGPVTIGYGRDVRRLQAQLQGERQETMEIVAVWEHGTLDDVAQLDDTLQLWRTADGWYEWNPTVNRVLSTFRPRQRTSSGTGAVVLQTFTLGHGATAKTFTKITYRGREGACAQELGRSLEYGRLGQDLEDRILEAWSHEFVAGTHYDLLVGAEFESFLELSGYQPLNQFKGQLLLLYQEGIDLVLLKTDSAAGRDVRAWLVADVFPGLRRETAAPQDARSVVVDPHKTVPYVLLHEEPIRVFLSKTYGQILADQGATADEQFGRGWNELHHTYFGKKAHEIRALAVRLGIPLRRKGAKKSARELAYEISELRAAQLRESAAIDLRRLGIDGPRADELYTSPAAIAFFEQFNALGPTMGNLLPEG